jgi:hypothetical protein
MVVNIFALRPLYPREIIPVPLEYKARWTPEPV